MFLYSGSEAAVGGWIAEHVHRLSADAPWTIAPTIFWGALSAGRLLTPLLLTMAAERSVLVAGLGSATLAIAALVAIPSVPVALVAAAVAGAGLAPAFPINFAALSRDIGPVASATCRTGLRPHRRGQRDAAVDGGLFLIGLPQPASGNGRPAGRLRRAARTQPDSAANQASRERPSCTGRKKNASARIV